ncbi:TetR/AcrR family transcriptional regulator [Microbacterium sp. K35]|uniref:TetR/AcrR family transcriptional regulator n=1 Tax=Microbacterium sp. K35 TaxID=2305440 RepID=UPI00109BEA6A|nr:TetR/AcrR family transcriptional regulator [Microbacterium sp. K35]MBN6190786.1 TetR/AcrR family transcriptional regulator [Aneurinibacillus sp. BA2021]
MPAPATPHSSNARGRATARAIETAAVRLALEKGPAALTVDEICAAAGVKQRTFFNHFPTKEDALLGSALPRLNEQRVREYLSDATVGVLSGALGLVELPASPDGQEDLAAARMRVLAASPALAERQAGRLLPLAREVNEVIRLKLRAVGPDQAAERIDAAASVLTRIASTLVLQAGRAGEAEPGLDDLRWIWDRLL